MVTGVTFLGALRGTPPSPPYPKGLRTLSMLYGPTKLICTLLPVVVVRRLCWHHGPYIRVSWFAWKLSKPSGKNICQSIGRINDMWKFSEFSVTVYYPHEAVILYKGNLEKYKGKFQKSVFWHFELLNLFKSCLLVLVYIPEILTHLLTPILPYIDMKWVR